MVPHLQWSLWSPMQRDQRVENFLCISFLRSSRQRWVWLLQQIKNEPLVEHFMSYSALLCFYYSISYPHKGWHLIAVSHSAAVTEVNSVHPNTLTLPNSVWYRMKNATKIPCSRAPGIFKLDLQLSVPLESCMDSSYTPGIRNNTEFSIHRVAKLGKVCLVQWSLYFNLKNRSL